MEDAAKPRVPRLVAGVDITSLPLGPLEGFVLSRIDGVLTAGEIADLTGLGRDEATDILERIVGLGAAEWVDQEIRARAPASARVPKPPSTETSKGEAKSDRVRRHSPPRGTVHTKPPPPGTSRSLYDPAELEEDVDLDLDRRRKVLDTFYRLEELDHYEVLGVPYEADKKQIRDAYFELSKTFHPDTLFRKRLGSYKQKMEAVFRRLTDAYETLGKKRARREYDAYLKDKIQTAKAIARLEQGRRDAEAIEREVADAAERAVVDPRGGDGVAPEPTAPERTAPEPTASEPTASEPTASEPTASEPAASEPAASDGAASPDKAPSPPPAAAPPRPRSPEARRRLQQLTARRLAAVTGRPAPGGVSRRPARPTPPAAPSPPAAAKPPAAPAAGKPGDRDVLLRGLASSLRHAASLTGGVDQVRRHLEDARKAEAADDLVAAANALRLAIAIAPERQDLVREHARVQREVSVRLADTYERQALYEERNGRWAAAALSWSRVVEGRPEDPAPARRAALALVEASGDLHQARWLAQKAVDLAPKDPKSRIVLGRVFLVAGLKLNARRELEAAAKLDPDDEMVKNLLREAKG